MIGLKASVNFADDHLAENGRLVLSVGHMVPEEFLKVYRKQLNSRKQTPAKTFRLRRSVRYQALGNQATIKWLAPYAAAQEAGMANGRVFRNYTTEGTGRGFAQQALSDTRDVFMQQFAISHPELGLQ